MTTVTRSKKRTRFGKLKVGEFFEWGEILPTYKKIDAEHAERYYPIFATKRYVFADKCLVYRLQFTRED